MSVGRNGVVLLHFSSGTLVGTAYADNWYRTDRGNGDWVVRKKDVKFVGGNVGQMPWEIRCKRSNGKPIGFTYGWVIRPARRSPNAAAQAREYAKDIGRISWNMFFSGVAP